MQSDVAQSREISIVGDMNASVCPATSSALCLVDSSGNNESHLKWRNERIQVCFMADTTIVQKPQKDLPHFNTSENNKD